MNIVIIGTGYVGLVTGVGLASLGNFVNFIDLDENKIKEQGLSKPEFTKKGIKLMKDTRSKLTQYLKKNREKEKAMKEAVGRTKNFKGGLIKKPRLAKRGF